jgi:hypothetical protein
VRWPKGALRRGTRVRFEQPHARRLLPFVGKIISASLFEGEIVYQVLVEFTDGTLYAFTKNPQSVADDYVEPIPAVRPKR